MRRVVSVCSTVAAAAALLLAGSDLGGAGVGVQPVLALRSALHPSPASEVAQAMAMNSAKPFADTEEIAHLRPADAQELSSRNRHHKHHSHQSHKNPAKDNRVRSHEEAAEDLVYVTQTSGTNDDRLAALPPLRVREHLGAQNGSGSVLHIYPDQLFQTIIGFGGAITEASVTVLNTMANSEEAIQTVLDAYYGEHGNRYSLARLHINSCDFSVKSWSFDDVVDDFDLKYFDTNLTHEQEYLLPFVHNVLKLRPDLRIFATPWSPPFWMKGNGAMDNSSFPGLKPDPRYHQTWANYLSKWITSIEEQGVPIWGMTVQNEPENPAAWEACVYNPAQQRDFIKGYLGPVMQQDHPDLKMMIYDHNKDHVQIWADTIYSDPEAAKYVWGMAIHWYSGDEFDNVNAVATKYPNMGLLATEATNAGPVPGSLAAGERYAHDILGDLNAFVQGWTDWNIVLDTQGGPNHLENWCDAPIIADVQNGTLSFQPMYFYLGHFSRFLPPGSQRIGHAMDNWEKSAGLEYATFLVQRPTGKDHNSKHEEYSAANPSPAGADVVLIVLNTHDEPAEFEVALGAGKRSVDVQMLPHTIQTITFDAKLLQ